MNTLKACGVILAVEGNWLNGTDMACLSTVAEILCEVVENIESNYQMLNRASLRAGFV